MNRIMVYLIAIFITALLLAVFGTNYADAKVIELKSPTQVAVELAKPGALVLMYGAPWCPACKSMYPEYKKASDQMPSIRFYYMNSDKIGLKEHSGLVRYIPMVFVAPNSVELRSKPQSLTDLEPDVNVIKKRISNALKKSK